MSARSAVLLVLLVLAGAVQARDMGAYRIAPHGQSDIVHPEWFKVSFLDLREDLREAEQAGKRGIIVFFSQKNCSHCKAFLETTLSDEETKERVQTRYDVIALDIFNDIEVTDIAGNVLPIRDFAERERARLTPTLIVYGVEGRALLKIVGFYPPEKFNRALDYVDEHGYDREPLSRYLTRSTPVTGSHSITVNHAIFAVPPHRLAPRPGKAATKPVLVVFDQPDCAACERFRARVLDDARVIDLMKSFHAVHLNRHDDSAVLQIPSGSDRTAHAWADDLQLSYDVSVVFFDAQGREVHRLDSEVGRDRMLGSMQYVVERAYLRHEQLLRWRREQVRQGNGRDAPSGPE